MNSLDSPRAEALERNLRLLAKDTFRHNSPKPNAGRAFGEATRATQRKGLIASRFVKVPFAAAVKEPLAPSPQTAQSPVRLLVARDTSTGAARVRQKNPVKNPEQTRELLSMGRQASLPGPSSLKYVSLITPGGGTLQIPRAGGKSPAGLHTQQLRHHARRCRCIQYVFLAVPKCAAAGCKRLPPPLAAGRSRRQAIQACCAARRTAGPAARSTRRP